MAYKCPQCEETPETMTAWKRHMSSAHGGYNDDDVRFASGSGDEGMFAAGEESFDSYAESLPDNVQDLVNPPPTEDEIAEERQAATEKEVKVARVAMSKKMKKKMEAFKSKLSETFPSLFFHSMAVKHEQPEWELTSDEKESIKDSIDTVLEILDIEFAFQPISLQLTSIWWVVCYPIIVFGFIFISKSTELKKDDKEK